MEKTNGTSIIISLALMLLLSLSVPASAVVTFDIPADIDVWVQAYDEILIGGTPAAILFEEEDPFVQESWIETKDFNLAAGAQMISFDMGYYTGGGDETDKFNVWLKDSADTIITPISSTLTFPWKSSDHSGSAPPTTYLMVFDSAAGFTDVHLQFHMLADGDLNYNPTLINISNITIPSYLPSVTIPAPGALLLGCLGLAFTGAWKRLRRSE